MREREGEGVRDRARYALVYAFACFLSAKFIASFVSQNPLAKPGSNRPLPRRPVCEGHGAVWGLQFSFSRVSDISSGNWPQRAKNSSGI